MIQIDSPENLLATADAISLHAPLTENTRHLIDRDSLARMKPHAWIINTSRGPLIHTSALVEALQEGKIGGAALDVFEEEPLPLKHRLRQCSNVILTPHAAYYSDSALSTLQRQAAEEVVRFARGERLASPVNCLRYPGEM